MSRKKKKRSKKRSQKTRKDEQFLQHLGMLSRTGASLDESAGALGMTVKELEDLFKKRPKVLRTWKQARLNLILHVRTALAKSAGEGKFAAIQKLLEELLRSEVAQQPAPAIDFGHLRTSELSIAIGKPRITIDRWRKSGLQRAYDKTYNLADVFAWFEGYCRLKFANASGVSGDPLRDIKAQQIQLQVSKHRGELVDRQKVICGLVAWVQNIKYFCEHGIEEHSRLCSNQPREKIAEIDRGFFRDLYVAAAKSPKELCLPAKMEHELIDFLERLKPHNYK